MANLLFKLSFPFTFFVLTSLAAAAQYNLQRKVNIHASQVKVAAVLDSIAAKGNFYFSYSNSMINTDRPVTVSARNTAVQDLLDQIFEYKVDYKESPGYIILRPAPNRLTLLPDTIGEPENTFYISGYVIDERTGEKLKNASVYEKQLMVSALTNDKGFFRIKLKTKEVITLTVSKELYKDTSVNFLNKVNVFIKPKKYTYSTDTNSGRAERSWLGRMFISSRQKIQAINLAGFITNVPVQTSLVPGLGSHGAMSGQTVNHFSVNALGGYNGGVDGMEVGGLFNINSQDVQYLQAAGLVNMTGGNARGLQAAGLSNSTLKNASGLQVAGLYNYTRSEFKGLQAAGLFNKTGTLKGFQASGIGNIVLKNSSGLQAAGLFNYTGDEAGGFQVAGLFNRARVLKGVHLSVVNIADTLEGYGIGLLNISRNGYHKISISTDETLTANMAFKSGNAKLYAILSAGANLTDTVRFYSLGLGAGHDFKFSKRLSLSGEFTSQLLLSGKWKNNHQLNRFSALLNIHLNPGLGFFIGPSFNVYSDLGRGDQLNEQALLTGHGFSLVNFGDNVKGWVGWSAGITFF
jgi:hypothetical protein